MKTTIRFILGYLVGGTIFLLLVPFGLYKLSALDYFNGYTILINSTVIKMAVSGLLLMIGLIFAIWSNIFLFMIGKGGPACGFGISISPQTKKLVTSGPYRYSRNPMVFGAFSIYLAIVLYLNSLFGLLALSFCFIFGIIYLKLSEEKRLIHDFGDEYRNYREKVAMIIPFLKI